MSRLLQLIWPTIVDYASARKGVMLAYYAATVLSVVFFFTAFLSTYVPQTGFDHRLDFIDAALFMILGLCLKGHDPYAAVLALALCALETVYRFSPLLLPIWVLLLILFASGVRASLWFLRFPEQRDQPLPGRASDTSLPAPPEAIADAAKRPPFFGLSGRLDRRWYATYLVVLGLFAVAAMGMLYALFGALGINAQAKTMLLGLCFLPIIFLSVMLTAQRCHDFDRSGWRALFLLLPLLGLLCFLIVPGSPGKNSYGPPNR